MFQRGVAEFVGTFTLVFIGAGTALTLAKTLAPAIGNTQAFDVYSGLVLVSIALANGLAIGVMVSAVGHISGGHFNPAITFGFILTRRMNAVLGVAYWIAQLLGAVLAALLTAGTLALSGALDTARGWGLRDESFHALAHMARFGEPTWFNLGDRDLATHLHRSRLLREGRTLTEATASVASGTPQSLPHSVTSSAPPSE